jgi:hypothetical protein
MSGGADGVVFIHGVKLDGSCLRPTMDVVKTDGGHRISAGDRPPERRGIPGETALGGCVQSAVGQIRAAEMSNLGLVGHSLAGSRCTGCARTYPCARRPVCSARTDTREPGY